MVFSSMPAYLDPTNWQQQQNHQIIGSSTTNPLLTPTPPPSQPHGGGGGGSIRPNSMAERARMANIPMPETALKCPRCESTNTKFCYFNNYSLTQPRHFCKTCRRYWTRNGALRNVPVGGGCRRNKRSKSTSSKSPASQGDRQITSSTSTTSMPNNVGTSNILGLPPALRFMSPLSQQLTDNFTNDMGLNFSGISSPLVAGTSEMNFHGTSNLLGGGGGVASLLSSGGGGIEPWRLQQFPFLGGLDTSSGIFQFHGGESGFMGGGEASQNVRPRLSSSMLTQMAPPPVKMEENPSELNLSRQLMGTQGIDQWNANAANNWNELSSFNSTSTRNAL